VIIVRLQGGLGNQMFQYAAGRALAWRKRARLVLDLTWYKQSFGPESTERRYELGCFQLCRSTKKISSKAAVRLTSLFAKDYQEPHFHYDPVFSRLPAHTVIHGYFQTEKYFSDVREHLLREFGWIHEPQGENLKILKEIQKAPESISVHVRRGDYITNQNVAKIHGITPMVYYEAALAKMTKKMKSPRLYIFSDDPEWCRENLRWSYPVKIVSNQGPNFEDMRLMKECRHHIIANSSFSWWGAWLSKNPDKLVIAPKKWFSCQEKNTKDLIPDSWHRL